MNKLEDEFEDILEENQFTELGTSPLTDETITQEQINEMKMLGIDKPETVSWERWTRIQNIRVEHDHMIHLAASGVPQWKIAQSLGYDQAHVSKILNTPDVRKRIQAEIQGLYGDDYKKAIKDRNMKAVGVMDDILESGKEAERASMAKWVLEHSVGKASQDVNVKTTSLVEVIHKINEMESNQLRDVGSNTEALPKPKHKFDNVIEQVIPKDMVIGKRGGMDEG